VDGKRNAQLLHFAGIILDWSGLALAMQAGDEIVPSPDTGHCGIVTPLPVGGEA